MAQKTLRVQDHAQLPNLKDAEQVKMVNFSTTEDGRLRKLGERANGVVYFGRVRFDDGSIGRVAIKRFKDRHTGQMRSMDDAEANRYQNAIDALTENGVDLPKMGMVKLAAGTVLGRNQGFTLEPEALKAGSPLEAVKRQRGVSQKVTGAQYSAGELTLSYTSGKKETLYEEAPGRFVKGAERIKKEEWVQVQQLFGSVEKGSKIREVTGEDERGFSILLPKDTWTDAAKNWMKVANAGYHPPWEMAEAFKNKSGKLEHLPFDIDVLTWPQFAKENDRDRTWVVARNIDLLTRGDQKEYTRLIGAAAGQAKPELRPLILAHQQKLGEKTPYLKEIEPKL